MPLAVAQDALVGRSFGEFVLRERIGEGGFGAVYRAFQTALDREAVVKVLHARLHASKGATERFLREAKLASKLDHPYAAHIYAFGAEPDGQAWIAMELVRGTPLDQVLKLQGPLSLERLVPLLGRICEVVHTAHEQGIVHRDLKPANVMVLARAGRLLPKLLDLGIAKGLAEIEPTGLTQRGAVMGSPPYMAPEQWLDAGRVGAPADLYALAILAYECLTGRTPYAGTTLTQIARGHATGEPAPLGPRFPGALDPVFARALAKDPGDRFPDALAFAAAFREASGVATEAARLPAIDPAQRDAAVIGAPQPIAEAIAAFEAARNAYQARDSLVLVGRTIARYLGLLALACRSRVFGEDGASEPIRTLYRRSLGDREWVELTRQLTHAWIDRRDAYPIPELIGGFHGGSVAEHLDALIALREADAANDAAMLALLEDAVGHATRLLEGLAFLRDYPLVVAAAGGHAERWMGVQRAQRSTVAVRGKGLAAGTAALLDRDGAPVLTLAPLFQIGAPTPGAAPDLFLFEGRDRRGAKLVALPSGFEHHDDTLWDWFRAQLVGSLDEAELAVGEERPPYRGLAAFSAEDHEMFIGREKLVDAFVNRLKLQPLLAVVGRSGAGKSSFVHAGVVPALRPTWRAVTLRPGPSPLGSLLARLEHAGIASAPELRDRLASDRDALGQLLRADAALHGPVLIVVDQLEEMFTLCQDAEEQRSFAEALAAAARDVEDPVRVVFTLRDDFLVRTEQVAALRNRIGQGLQILTVPAADDLLRIVTEPARRVGYELEGSLAADMVREVADQPGALALISFTARKLWELRDRHFKQLTQSAYKTLGGVGGALARHAELTLDGMLAEERALTREAFRHLVTAQNTRDVLPRKELRQLLGNDAHADGVIEKLVAARLLVASENESGAETIEIVHEALLVTWPRLVEWRREDSEGKRFREQLRSAAKQWDERGRAKGLLWRGDALGELTRWRERHAGPLTDVEDAFSGASLADVARARRNVRLLVAGAFAALGAVVVGLVLLNARVAGQRERAQVAATELHDSLQRRYEDQGRQLVLADDPLHALAYLDEARELGASGRAHDLLVAAAIQQSSGALLELSHDHAARSPDFSADGSRLITAGFDRVVRIWDTRTGAKLLELAHDDGVLRASFAPDESTVLTASVDNKAVLWNAATGRALHTFAWSGRCAMYGPGGDLALTAGGDVVAVWELPAGTQRFERHVEGASACAISRDGTLIAVTDRAGATRIWDARSGALRQEVRGSDKLAFSPDGTRLVTAGGDGTAALWTVATGALEHTFTHGATIESVGFSPAGDRVITGSRDGTAAIWDVAAGTRVLVLAGHDAAVNQALYSPDGKHVVTASSDATAWMWDAATGLVEARWRGHQDRVADATFDPAGTRVATVGDDGKAILWSAVAQEEVVWLVGHEGPIQDAQFSPSGSRVATAGVDGTVRVWASTGEELLQLRGHRGPATSVVFSPDDRSIATVGEDGTLQIWDGATGVRRQMLETAATGAVDAFVLVAWSPDGSSVATASHDGTIRCWETETWTPRFESRGHGGHGVYSVAFAPDSRTLITAGADLATRIWSLDGSLVSSRPDPESPIAASFDPSGVRVLSNQLRQRATIWNVQTGRAEVVLIGHSGMITDAKWGAAGAYAVTSSFDGTARIWDASTGDNILIIRHPSVVNVTTFSLDGARVVLGGADGRAAIHTLPTYRGTTAELIELQQCRVPFEVQADRLTPRRTVCTPPED